MFCIGEFILFRRFEKYGFGNILKYEFVILEDKKMRSRIKKLIDATNHNRLERWGDTLLTTRICPPRFFFS